MSVQCHYKYNNELHHFRMGEYRKTDDDKQACIIEFVLFLIHSTNYYDHVVVDKYRHLTFPSLEHAYQHTKACRCKMANER